MLLRAIMSFSPQRDGTTPQGTRENPGSQALAREPRQPSGGGASPSVSIARTSESVWVRLFCDGQVAVKNRHENAWNRARKRADPSRARQQADLFQTVSPRAPKGSPGSRSLTRAARVRSLTVAVPSLHAAVLWRKCLASRAETSETSVSCEDKVVAEEPHPTVTDIERRDHGRVAFRRSRAPSESIVDAVQLPRHANDLAPRHRRVMHPNDVQAT